MRVGLDGWIGYKVEMGGEQTRIEDERWEGWEGGRKETRSKKKVAAG